MEDKRETSLITVFFYITTSQQMFCDEVSHMNINI